MISKLANTLVDGHVNPFVNGLSDHGNLVLVAYTVFIIVLFFIFWGHLYIKTKNIRNDIGEANRPFDYQENHLLNFYKKYEDIDKSLNEITSFSHTWNEFKEHMIFPSNSEGVGDPESLKIRNSIPPENFFHEEVFVNEKIDRRFLDSIPGILTGLGILGTFLGLTIGISSATHTLRIIEGQDTTQLMAMLIKLLKGASLAFVTSILGISLSIIFSWLEKSKITGIRKELDKFLDNLERSLEFITSEQINREIKDAIIEQSKKFDSFSNELALAIGNTLSNSFEGPIKDGFNKIISGLSSIKNVQQNLSEDLMKGLIDKFSGNLSSQAQENQNKARESFENLQSAFTNQAHEMIRSQDKMAEISRELISEITKSNKENQDKVNSQLSSTIEKLNNTMGNIVQSFKSNLVESSHTMSEKIRNSFESVANNINKQQEESGRQFLSSTKEASEAMKGVTNEIVQSQSKIAEVPDKLLKEIDEIGRRNQDIIENQLSSTMKNFDSLVKESFNTIANGINDREVKSNDSLNSSIQKVSELMSNLNNSISSFNKLIDSNNSILEKNKSIVLDQKNIAQSLLGSTDKIVSSGKSIEEAGVRIGEASVSFGETSKRIEESNRAIENAWRDYQERFQGVDKSMNEIFEVFQGRVGKIVEQYRSSINILGDQIQELGEMIDENKGSS